MAPSAQSKGERDEGVRTPGADQGRRATRRTRKSIDVQGTPITILSREGEDFISLTDMVRDFEGGSALIDQWLMNKDTLLFLGIWEELNNPSFDTLTFEKIRDQAGRSSFFLSVEQWAGATGARGIAVVTGRRGGTFAHRDIAFEFGSWLSPEFKLFLITQFQRLKGDESRRLSEAWDLSRALSRLNYKTLSATIKERLVPPSVTPEQAAEVYRSEADLLNVALFGQTAEEWREAQPELTGTMRDYASIAQLLVLAGLENLNAEFIRLALPQDERLRRLNEIAIRQMSALAANDVPRRIGQGEPCAE